MCGNSKYHLNWYWYSNWTVFFKLNYFTKGGKRRIFFFKLDLPSKVTGLYVFFFGALLLRLLELRYVIPGTCFPFLPWPNLLKGKDLIFAGLMILCIVFGTLLILQKVLAQGLRFINICGMTAHKVTCSQYFCDLSLHHVKEKSQTAKWMCHINWRI